MEIMLGVYTNIMATINVIRIAKKRADANIITIANIIANNARVGDNVAMIANINKTIINRKIYMPIY